ncbi:expressed unknown protein [Seminavis robusta]|uniref:Uncharacterized protein n=1 Tax=Seminavis robusta TaxID=568900 RepID=A0A9N8HHH6_9STRA|nr:expressed unknown protein [Seminavis robusta]|eukprot:Sro537_g162371.1  (136) ;mRNA; r:42006-42413
MSNRFLALALLLAFRGAYSFSPTRQSVARLQTRRLEVSGRSTLMLFETEESQETSESNGDAVKASLEEKMKNWEATEEEVKAATLGGVVPERADSFDLGLYVAFPFMIIGCLLFLAFPLLADKIDVSSVGPPPTS